MKKLKKLTSDRYHDYLIESLKNTEEAAGYIEITLEAGSDEPLLLRNALHNVVEARARMNNLSFCERSRYSADSLNASEHKPCKRSLPTQQFNQELKLPSALASTALQTPDALPSVILAANLPSHDFCMGSIVNLVSLFSFKRVHNL